MAMPALMILPGAWASRRATCPSSDKMGHQSGLSIGGSGSVV
jgi:hypothetical protein